MLACVDLEERVPLDHPLRAIKTFADTALAELSGVFDRMDAVDGRPSGPRTGQPIRRHPTIRAT
jgi:hypothetical protein